MSSQIRTKISTNNLFGYFDITNPNSYAYNGATQWLDLSGNNLTFTLSPNLPVYDPVTGGISFTSSNQQYAITPPSTAGPRSGEYTWGGWFKFTDNNEILNGVYPISRGRDTTGAPGPDGWSLTVGSYNGTALAACTQDDQYGVSYTTVATSTTSVNLNSWIYIIGTFKTNDYVKIYVNGEFGAQTAINSDLLRQSIGAGWVVASIQDVQFASCIVSSFIIYNRVLTENEILQNYNANKGRHGL